jgi:hypothetical protein
VCFRLLAAVQPSPESAWADQLAVKHGLDIRRATKAAADYIEIAWGECACSLVTRGEGRARALAFVDALLVAGMTVQLLLGQDDDEVVWTDGPPAVVAWSALAAQGLRALPEGRPARVDAGG